MLIKLGNALNTYNHGQFSFDQVKRFLTLIAADEPDFIVHNLSDPIHTAKFHITTQTYGDSSLILIYTKSASPSVNLYYLISVPYNVLTQYIEDLITKIKVCKYLIGIMFNSIHEAQSFQLRFGAYESALANPALPKEIKAIMSHLNSFLGPDSVWGDQNRGSIFQHKGLQDANVTVQCNFDFANLFLAYTIKEASEELKNLIETETQKPASSTLLAYLRPDLQSNFVRKGIPKIKVTYTQLKEDSDLF